MGAKGRDYDEEAEEYEEEEPEPDAEPDGEYIDEEEEEDDEEDDRQTRKRRRASKFLDDAAEEEDDDEDDHPKKKKGGRATANPFIDDTAEVTDEDDDEEDLEAEDGFVDDTGVFDAPSSRGAPRPILPQDDDNMENIEEFIQNRYRRHDYVEDADPTEVEQQALLPSVRDPKLWMLTCMQGHEREAVSCLMQKYMDMLARGEPLLIKSALAIDHLKGYIYVEADRENHVRQAIRGLRSIFQKVVQLVPIKEMTDVLTVERKSIDLDKENWVRVKSGIYKDDLGRVLDVDHVRQRARIKLVPRIDLSEVVAKLEDREVNKPKGKFSRPPQRFINIQELKDLKIPVEKKRDQSTGEPYEQFLNYQLIKGYLIKTVSLRSLLVAEPFPSLDEIQAFQKPGDEDDANALGLPSAGAKKSQFMKGDTVVVTEGDLRNLMGIVEKVDEDHVEMRPKDSELKDVLKFPIKQLSKFFKAGDHVKVMSGKYEGSTGMIVKVESRAVVILSDTTKEDLRVFKDTIVESSEVTSGLTKIGDFELHDLISLDRDTVGVIVRIEADGCQVLKGVPDKQEVVTVKQRDLRKRPFNKQVNAQDRNMNAVAVKDIVRVVEGIYKDKQGPVEHISRGILFIQDRHHVDNGGFLCVRANSCLALGGSRGEKNFLVSRFESLKPPSQYLQSPRRSPVRGSYGPPSNGYGGRQPGRRHDTLIGRIVKIRLGPFKGYRGRVKDVNNGNIRIELESQMKVVSVRRDQLSDVGDTPSSSYREPSRYGAGSETPVHPSRTPMHSAFMTPMRDITATPMHEGMRTPMRDRPWNAPYATPLRDPSDENGWGSGTSPQYPPPGTPLATRSYEAPTPGGWAGSPGGYSDSGSPVENAPYGNPSSPYMPSTPGGLPMTPAAPSYLPGTPGGQPMTPGGLDPTSPAAAFNNVQEQLWGLPEVIVSVRRPTGELSVGVIQEVLPDGSCRVALGATGDGETITVSHSEMEIKMPQKNDRVKIVSGEFRGYSGRLIGIDGSEGIVRVDGLDVTILHMALISKKYEREQPPNM